MVVGLKGGYGKNNPQLIVPTSKWDVRPQYKQLRKASKTSTKDTKHDSHARFPKMGLEHQHVSFKPILHRFGKMTITFSTDLGLMRFKSHFEANTLPYLPTKNQNFGIGRSLPVSFQRVSCFSENSSSTALVCFFIFFTNPQLKLLFKSM